MKFRDVEELRRYTALKDKERHCFMESYIVTDADILSQIDRFKAVLATHSEKSINTNNLLLLAAQLNFYSQLWTVDEANYIMATYLIYDFTPEQLFEYLGFI